MSVSYVAPNTYAWELELEDGEKRAQVLAPSLRAAVGTLPVVKAARGAAVVAGLPLPVVATLVPASAQLGAPSFTLRVQGTGFQSHDAILWNGTPEPTTFVSDTELTTEVDMSTATVAVAIPVAVRTALGEVSNALDFDLQPAP